MENKHSYTNILLHCYAGLKARIICCRGGASGVSGTEVVKAKGGRNYGRTTVGRPPA